MSQRTKLANICPFRLNETYKTLYELQETLGINDDYLLNTSRKTIEDEENQWRLEKLLYSLRVARDNLITWYLKENLVELNVTISLLTAKIKFIEYKLELCDGLDLHQACSLSLVNFCSILADMTVLNVERQRRKTMHKISVEANIPIWLSHYRNQICHVPSESPCISILVPLIIKSLKYMQESFWSKVIKYESFDSEKFTKLLVYIMKLVHVTSMNRRLRMKERAQMITKKRQRVEEQKLRRYSITCLNFKKLLVQNSNLAMEILARSVTAFSYHDKSKNFALLIEQVIFAQRFEQFVFKIVSLAEENPEDKNITSWLCQMITLVGLRKKLKLKETLRKMELSASKKMVKYTEISPIKCCHMAYRLANLESQIAKKLVIRLRYKLVPILGKRRTVLLMKLTRCVKI